MWVLDGQVFPEGLPLGLGTVGTKAESGGTESGHRRPAVQLEKQRRRRKTGPSSVDSVYTRGPGSSRPRGLT